MRRQICWGSVALLVACGDAEGTSTSEISPSQGGTAGLHSGTGGVGGAGSSAGTAGIGSGTGGVAGAAGSTIVAGSSGGSGGPGGSGGAGGSAGAGGTAGGPGGGKSGEGGGGSGSQAGSGTGAGQGGQAAGQGGQAGAAGAQSTVCQGLQIGGNALGLTPASDPPGVGNFALASVDGTSVFVLGVSEVTEKETLRYGLATSLVATPWPSTIAPFEKVQSAPLYDVALVPATDSNALGLMLTITNSASFSMSAFDLSTHAQTPVGDFNLGADATSAEFVAERPGGFVGAASIATAPGGKTGHSTFALLAKKDGTSVTGQVPLACAQGKRALVSGFHRPGETIVFAASESGACTGENPNLRLLSLPDGEDTLIPQTIAQFPAPGGDLYETVLAADAGAGSTWLVSRQLGLNAEVQPPVEVRRIGPDGSEAIHFELNSGYAVTRNMAIASFGGGLLIALPDNNLTGQGEIDLRLYGASGDLAAQTTVYTAASTGGSFAFNTRLRLLPLGSDSFVIGYRTAPYPGFPTSVHLVKLTCSGAD